MDPLILVFFAVLVRLSVLFAVTPIYGDRVVPGPVKILLSVALSILMFPVLLSAGRLDPAAAQKWGASVSGIVSTISIEVVTGLVIGYSCKLLFDGIQMGTELVGNFMGFAMASQFDPHQETQTEVISRFHMVLTMLLFLAMDGHQLVLQGALKTFEIIPIGGATFGGALSQYVMRLGSECLWIAIQIAAPMALSLFVINVIYGVLSKAMPQLNILTLSLSVSAAVGLLVLGMSLPAFHDVTAGIVSRMEERMTEVSALLAGR